MRKMKYFQSRGNEIGEKDGEQCLRLFVRECENCKGRF